MQTNHIRAFPVIWIFHEWWDDEMIVQNLALRNMTDLTLATVKLALTKATKVVFVCEAQKQLYNPATSAEVIYVGVPNPICKNEMPMLKHQIKGQQKPFTFLYIGIVCPRKNQIWAVELFKEFAKLHNNVRFDIVGARRTRKYEIEYLNKLIEAIDGDPKIFLHDVTDDVDKYYEVADCLLFTSLNEVTPMVISEVRIAY